MTDVDTTISDITDAIPPEQTERDAVRERVLQAAAVLLETEGRDALTTRAISTAAGVQPPALYRLFGDKSGLLDALAAHGFSHYLRAKRIAPHHEDPVQALRDGWDAHVGFGLEHPAAYLLVYGEPRPTAPNTARRQGDALLGELVERAAVAGRLRTSVRRATEVIASASIGTVMTLLSVPGDERDPELSATVREATLRSLTTDEPPDPRPASATVAAATLAAALRRPDRPAALGDAERTLLVQWLDEIAEA